MKNFILSLFLSLTLFGTVQGQGDHSESKITKKINVERIDVVVTVNSVNDIKNTFETNDIKDMMDMAESDQPISFEK